MPKVRSKAEAAFWGGVAGGAIKKKGLTPAEGKARTRGVDVKNLPARTRRRNAKG